MHPLFMFALTSGLSLPTVSSFLPQGCWKNEPNNVPNSESILFKIDDEL